jgi:hypothetical protein
MQQSGRRHQRVLAAQEEAKTKGRQEMTYESGVTYRAPKLIAMLKVGIPKVMRNGGGIGIDEMIEHMAVDEDGNLWALVVRMHKIEGTNIIRLSYNRFHKLEDVRFESDNPIAYFEKER